MIRPFTCVCMILAAGSGLYVYQTKHRGQLLDKEIERTIKTTEAVRQRITMLQSEWAGLNEPERLADLMRQHAAELAQQHITLRTSATTQLAALNDLGTRLPAPLPPGTAYAPTDEGEDTPSIPTGAAPAPGPVAAARPAPTRLAAAPARPTATAAPPAPAAVPTAAPIQVAALPTPPANPHPASKPPARAAATERGLPEPPAADRGPDRVAVAQIAAQAGARPPAAALPPGAVPVAALAPARPHITAPVVTVGAAPIAPPRRPAPASATASPVVPAASIVSNPSSAPGIGSVLGGVRPSLPPPVPYAAPASR